jgi:hypothetical protein
MFITGLIIKWGNIAAAGWFGIWKENYEAALYHMLLALFIAIVENYFQRKI